MKTLKKENPRENSLLGPQFSSSQIGRKIVGRKVDLWNFYTNALWNQVKKRKEKEKKRMDARKESKKNKKSQLNVIIIFFTIFHNKF